MAGSAAARRCRRSPTIPATPTARAAREQIPLLGRRRRKLDKISWHGAAARWWLRRRGRLRGRSRCRGWRGQYRSQRAPPRASSRPTSRCPPSLRRPKCKHGRVKLLAARRERGRCSAHGRGRAGGRRFCACGVARSGESNGAVDGLLFVCSLHRGDFEAQVGCSEAKRRVSVLRCLCAAAFASIGAGVGPPCTVTCTSRGHPVTHPGGSGATVTAYL